MSMIPTGKVAGRRQLRFASIDDVLQDAEMLAAAPHVSLLGNWTLGQIFQHLATTQNMSVDGFDASLRPNALLRWLALFMKRSMLNKGMPAGFQIPERAASQLVASPSVSKQEGLTALRESCQRIQTRPPVSTHPGFGSMSPDEWLKLNLRHAELHLSFAVPEPSTPPPAG